MRLVGPVFYYDLVRSARRGRVFLVRALYVLFLLLTLFGLYLLVEPRLTLMRQSAGGVSPRMLIQLAEGFFIAFMVLQYLGVLVLTPGMVAGAITEEKQRQTLDFLFTTDLLNREIILGKFASRLGSSLMLLLAGVPVLSLVQLFGGVEPLVLVAFFTITLVTMISVACLALYFSVLGRRVREALLKTYLVVVGYLAGWGVLELFWGLSRLDNAAGAPLPQAIRDVIEAYNVANPIILGYRFAEFARMRTPLAFQALTHQGLAYLCIHLALAGWFLLRSIQIVRKVYLRQTHDPKPKKRLKGWMAIPVGEAARWLVTRKAKQTAETTPLPRRYRRRPNVGPRPMTWKECHVERGLRFGVVAETFYVMLLFLLLSPLVVLWGVLAVNQWFGTGGFDLERIYNGYFRLAAVALVVFAWGGAGLRAAASIGAERDRQTWDGLMGSMLTLREVIAGKVWGCLWSVRRLLYLLAGFAFAGVIVDAINWFAAVVFMAAVLIFTLFATNLGMYAAARTHLTQRAIFNFLFWFALVNALPSMASLVLEGLQIGLEAKWIETLAYFSPVQAIFYLPSHSEEQFLNFSLAIKQYGNEDDYLPRVGMIILSLVGYALAAGLLWVRALKLLRQSAGRVEHIAHTKQEKRLAAAWAKDAQATPQLADG